MTLRRFACFLLSTLLLLTPCLAPAEDAPTQTEAQERMLALKDEFYEGRHWTNNDSYAWNGGIYSIGYGCMGFAFRLSDEAFGDLPARVVSPADYDSLQVGDILRVNNDSHGVVIVEKHDDYVVLAEGNYNSSIHWGRTMSKDDVMAADYALSRYPASAGSPTPGPGAQQPSPAPSATPAPSPTRTPVYTAPVYMLRNVFYGGGVLSGRLIHNADTPEAQALSIRVTFYITGNYYMGTAAEVEPDGSFAVEGVGPIEYITVIATGVDPAASSRITFSAAELFIQ